MEVNHQEQEQRNCFAQERKWLFSASLHIPLLGGGGGLYSFPSNLSSVRELVFLDCRNHSNNISNLFYKNR